MVDHVDYRTRFAHGQELLVATVDLRLSDEIGYVEEVSEAAVGSYAGIPEASAAGRIVPNDVANAIDEALSVHVPPGWVASDHQELVARYDQNRWGALVLHIVGDLVLERSAERGGELLPHPRTLELALEPGLET